MDCMKSNGTYGQYSPWINGIKQAAAYAHMDINEMRRLVKGGVVTSRKRPVTSDGKRPRGVLVYAPSIDALLMEQPSGAAPIAQALRAVV